MKPTAVADQHRPRPGRRRGGARRSRSATATIAGAGLDVYEREPEVTEALLAARERRPRAAPRQRHPRHARRDGDALRRARSAPCCSRAARRPTRSLAFARRDRLRLPGDVGRPRAGARAAAAARGRGPRRALRLARRPRLAAAAAEHEALRALLEAAGAEVIVSEHDPGNPDAIYVYDPVLVGDGGAALLRPGKEGRLGEPDGDRRGPRGGRRAGRVADGCAGDRRGRRHRLARPRHAARRPRLPHRRGRDRRAARCVPGRRGGRARPAALGRRRPR